MHRYATRLWLVAISSERAPFICGGNTMRTRTFVLLSTLATVASLPIWAESGACVAVGGALMTNIGVIGGVYNMGPAFGDLHVSVAAQILSFNSNGTYTV